MKICIGVISYLPDNKKLREIRVEKLSNLLHQCDELFKLPIMIIAQNWDELELNRLNNSKVILYNYKNKLGITEARRALRNKFLASEFDYLVMLDDDILLKGDETSIGKYIEQIEAHPNMYGTFKQLTLQLFAISKEVYKLVDFPAGGPENSDFFEDMYIIMALNKLHEDRKFTFNKYNLDAMANATDCITSTWYAGQSRHLIGDNTRRLISEL